MEDGSINTVFVGNLSWSTTDEELSRFMSSAGTVVSASVQCHVDTGRSKGWGLVEYASASDAANAVQTLNNSDMEGRNVHVRLDRSKIESSGGHAVFVGNLPWSTTDAELATLFNAYEPYDAHVKTNMAGRSRGFAILRFSDENQALKAINEMNGYEIDGRPIQVRGDRDTSNGGEAPVRPAGKGRGGGGGARGAAAGGGENADTPAAPTSVVFVGNLAWGTTDDDLLAHFSTCPGALSARVQMALSGRSKGWALVQFETPEQAEGAVAVMNNTMLHERALAVRLDRN